MKTKDFLKQHKACVDGAKWALSIGEEMDAVWDAMIAQEKYDWLLWTLSRPGVLPDSVLRKLACRFVRETPLADGRKVWDLLTDERSRRAVEVAEAYAEGKATKQELNAANDAADDAYAAAYDEVAVVAAAYAAYAAVDDAAYTAARVAARAAYAAACAADDAGYDDYNAAYAHAKPAQIKMIAEIGNPFKEERAKR